MNKIFAECNLDNAIWSVNYNAINVGAANIVISITATDQKINNLKLGFHFYEEYNKIASEEFLSNRYNIQNIKGAYTIEPSIYFEKEKKFHKIHFWTEHNEKYFEKIIIIDNVIPKQPHPSWTFIAGEWQPPVARPVSGITVWCEKTKEWRLVDHEYMPNSGGSNT